MSALAIIIIAGGIIAVVVWLSYKAIHADPADAEETEMYLAETAVPYKPDETEEIAQLRRDLDFFMCMYYLK